jgi:hypothetical protein
VLTKPDIVQQHEEDQWLRLLRNEGRERFNLGIFITKQPSQPDVDAGISFEAARQAELLFFQNNGIWREASTDMDSWVGTPQLTAALSRLLSGHIQRA